MHEAEEPVVRPYWLVDHVAAAAKAAEAIQRRNRTHFVMRDRKSVV